MLLIIRRLYSEAVPGCQPLLRRRGDRVRNRYPADVEPTARRRFHQQVLQTGDAEESGAVHHQRAVRDASSMTMRRFCIAARHALLIASTRPSAGSLVDTDVAGDVAGAGGRPRLRSQSPLESVRAAFLQPADALTVPEARPAPALHELPYSADQPSPMPAP